MARVLIHDFQGGNRSYVEDTDDAMVRRIAEVLARNIDEIEDPEVVEEILACVEEPASIETAETAIRLYCEGVPEEGLTLSVAHGTAVKVQSPAPPLAESVAGMRRHLEGLLDSGT